MMLLKGMLADKFESHSTMLHIYTYKARAPASLFGEII